MLIVNWRSKENIINYNCEPPKKGTAIQAPCSATKSRYKIIPPLATKITDNNFIYNTQLKLNSRVVTYNCYNMPNSVASSRSDVSLIPTILNSRKKQTPTFVAQNSGRLSVPKWTPTPRFQHTPAVPRSRPASRMSHMDENFVSLSKHFSRFI